MRDRYVPPTMTLVQKLSAYTLGMLSDKDLPDIALTGLDEGYDSPSLRILAGYRSSDNPFQLKDYFEKALMELGIAERNQRDSLIEIIKYYADQIVHKKLDPYLGFDQIDKILLSTQFEYRDIFLDKCYVDYISIWEVQNDGLQLHEGSGLTKDQYIEATKNELISNLRQWLTETGGT